MKNKDSDWYEEKVQDIKRRKRNLAQIMDYTVIKKMKRDLKIEQRAAKRAEKNYLKKWLNKEINDDDIS